MKTNLLQEGKEGKRSETGPPGRHKKKGKKRRGGLDLSNTRGGEKGARGFKREEEKGGVTT